MTPDNEVRKTIERFLATRREGPTVGELIWALPQYTRVQIEVAVSRLMVTQGVLESRGGRLALGQVQSDGTDAATAP